MENNTRNNTVGYLLGVSAWTIIGGIFMLTYVDFFYDDLGLEDGLFNLGLVIYAGVNAINDPILSIMSDRTDRKRWGSRRLIYIRWGGLMWCIFFVLAWFPWSYTDQIVIFFHFLFTMCTCDMGLSLVVGCWMALLPEIAPNVNDRLKLSYLSGIVGILAGFLVIVFAGTKALGIPAFQIMSIGVAVLCFIMFFLVATFVHEREEYKDDEALSFLNGLKETIKSKSFMIFVGYNLFSVVAVSLLLPYLFIYQLITPLNIMGFYAMMVVNALFGNLIGMKLRPKWGIRKIILRFGSVKVIVGLLFFFLSLNALGGELALTVTLIGYICISLLGGIYGGFGHTLLTLSMDEDELKTGVRRENTFLGVNALFTKPGDSIGPIIATLILGATFYVRNSPAEVQPVSAMAGIIAIFFLVPAILTLFSLIFMYFYPIHGDYMKKMYEDLEILHEEKKQRLFKTLEKEAS